MAQLNKILINKIEEIKKDEKQFSKFVNYMQSKGIKRNKYSQYDKVSQSTIDVIDKYFNKEKGDVEMEVKNESAITVEGNVLKKDNEDIDNVNKLNRLEPQEENEQTQNLTNEEKDKADKDLHENFVLDKTATNIKNRDKKDKTLNKEKEENDRKNKIYKMQDNIVYLTQEKEVELEDVKLLQQKGDNYTRFGAYIQAGDLAQWFEDEILNFDPTMQRGVKEVKVTKKDEDGQKRESIETRAFFRESHLDALYESMEQDTFTPTQILLGVIIDEGDSFEYDEYEKRLNIKGKIRLLDGQHRVRTFVRVKNAQMTGKCDADINLQDMPVNVEIFCVTAEKAREIYANTGKNLRLNKAQTEQLASTYESKIINFLNQDSSSELKGKIATTRPVNKKLVLFNTLTEQLSKSTKILTNQQTDELKLYLKDFFNYLVNKLPEAFGKDEETRIEFRKNNLLNENNMFKAWIMVALADKENYKQNIDKIIENKEMFNKDNPKWDLLNTVKKRTKKNDKNELIQIGWSMNNTSKGITGLIDETIELIKK